MVREGALTEQSLTDAVEDEHRRRGGAVPLALLVSGIGEMERVALQILSPATPLACLVASMPHVAVDSKLKPGCWELVARP